MCNFTHFSVCLCLRVRVCVCISITYVPAEYLEEYKASLEQTQEDAVSETAPAPKYVHTLRNCNECHVSSLETEMCPGKIFV